MELNKFTSSPAALVGRALRLTATAKATHCSGGECHRRSKLVIAPTGINELRFADFAGNVSPTIRWLMNPSFTPPVCASEQVTYRLSWRAYRNEQIARRVTVLLPLADSNYLLCRGTVTTGGSHV